MDTIQLLNGFVEHHQILVYELIFLGLVFEGEITVILSGILSSLGALNPWIAIIVILFGGFSKTFIGYSFGEFLFKKFNHHGFFKYIKNRVHLMMPRFKQKPFWSIFISKFIIGANNIVILYSGFEKINYRKYLKSELLANIIWVPLLFTLGYFFSYTALHVSQEVSHFVLIVLILIIGFIILDRLIGWVYKIFEGFYGDTE